MRTQDIRVPLDVGTLKRLDQYVSRRRKECSDARVSRLSVIRSLLEQGLSAAISEKGVA
jgi:hypothetical protein